MCVRVCVCVQERDYVQERGGECLYKCLWVCVLLYVSVCMKVAIIYVGGSERERDRDRVTERERESYREREWVTERERVTES